MQEPLRTLLPELGSAVTLQICINPNSAELTTEDTEHKDGE